MVILHGYRTLLIHMLTGLNFLYFFPRPVNQGISLSVSSGENIPGEACICTTVLGIQFLKWDALLLVYAKLTILYVFYLVLSTSSEICIWLLFTLQSSTCSVSFTSFGTSWSDLSDSLSDAILNEFISDPLFVWKTLHILCSSQFLVHQILSASFEVSGRSAF